MPSENEQQALLNQSQNKTSVKTAGSESEPLYEGKPRLSTKEAYAIALERGFKGKQDSFRSGIRRSPDFYKTNFGIVKIGRGEYIDISDRSIGIC